MTPAEPESNTRGAGLRQSHFGSGYDAGKARLQAEVEQLKAQVAAMEAVVEAQRSGLQRILEWDCLNPEPRSDLLHDLPWLKQHVQDLLSRLDAADAPAASTREVTR